MERWHGRARLALIALAQHTREPGAGVSVTRFLKTGSVACAKIPALLGMDLSAYRGKAREEFRVRPFDDGVGRSFRALSQLARCGTKPVPAATQWLRRTKKQKTCYQFGSRFFIFYLGWLMGLEPTTTGITIRGNFPASMRVCGVFMGNYCRNWGA